MIWKFINMLITSFVGLLYFIAGSTSISCHQCGNIYDGTSFMDMANFSSCRLFENETTDTKNYMVDCPRAKCCFVLREYMSIEFWGHAAAAEVLVRGCCSKLNEIKHHLINSEPPPLAIDSAFHSEIMSETIQNEFVKTRILFCNSNGCNNKGVPWSQPVLPTYSLLEESRARMKSRDRRQNIREEENLLNLFEQLNISPQTILEQNSNSINDDNIKRKPKLNRDQFLTDDAEFFKPLQSEKEELESKLTRTDSVPRCACNCNCPSLVCPTYQISNMGSTNRCTNSAIFFMFNFLIFMKKD